MLYVVHYIAKEILHETRAAVCSTKLSNTTGGGIVNLNSILESLNLLDFGIQRGSS